MGALTEIAARLRACAADLEALDAPVPVPAPVPEPAEPAPAVTARPMAWGAKVSPVFRARILWLADDLDIGTDPADGADKTMTCIAWESGRSFRPDVRNMAGSGATGLIQFMPLTALGFFYTAAQIKRMSDEERLAKGRACCDRLAALSAEDQINYVWRYFEPYKGRLKSLADLYMAILWPAGVGKPDSFVLWDKTSRPTTYRQNAGLDVNKDGQITKAEAAAKVAALLPEGLRQGNVA